MASLSGCSDTELASIDTAQEKTPIGFHTVGSQMGSRATIIDNGTITNTDFKVYAFTNDKNLFEISNMLRENGYKVLTELNNIKLKKAMNRQKDIEDIELIEKWLNESNH